MVRDLRCTARFKVQVQIMLARSDDLHPLQALNHARQRWGM